MGGGKDSHDPSGADKGYHGGYPAGYGQYPAGYPAPPGVYPPGQGYPVLPGGYPQPGGYPPSNGAYPPGAYPPSGYPHQPTFPPAGYPGHGPATPGMSSAVLRVHYLILLTWTGFDISMGKCLVICLYIYYKKPLTRVYFNNVIRYRLIK
jgi:hypothetical protein